MNISEITSKFKLNKKVISAILILVVLLIGWRVVSSIVNKPETVKSIPLVRTITIGETSTTNGYTYPGEVRGKYESNLAFQVAGKIISRNVNLGDNVTAGQVIMSLDPKDVKQSVEASSAALAAAQANYNLARGNAKR